MALRGPQAGDLLSVDWLDDEHWTALSPDVQLDALEQAIQAMPSADQETVRQLIRRFAIENRTEVNR